jgi:NitT/TauT family transport system substrate-binding protein
MRLKAKALATKWPRRIRLSLRGILIVIVTLSSANALAADRIRVAVQKTGTLAWELEIARAHDLDRQADLAIDTTELASTEAGKIALKGGAVDIIVSDWLWVTRERSLGDNLVFYPYSSALGAVMVPADSPIKDVTDLKGKKLGVAGGPLDKSWLLLQALARRSGIDLTRQAQVAYGAPPLLTQKALQGETDATLTFWNFCVDLEAKGMRRAVSMTDVVKRLGATGPVAMVGYVFDGGWAQRNRAPLDRFFTTMHKAEGILTDSPAEWQRLAPRIGVSDPSALDIYRRRFIEDIPHRSLADEEADAKALYRVLAEIGGADLVGPARELDPGTFYRAGQGE